MTLRTPRRRISPRTKRRCRAIKDFLWKALGTSSPPGTKTSSSTEVSVSDLKSQIIDIEQQLSNVSKHCQDLTCLEHHLKKESESSLVQHRDDRTRIENTEYSDTNDKNVETKLLYKSSNSQQRTNKNNIVSTNRQENTNDTVSVDQNVVPNIPDFQLNQKNIDFREKRRFRNDFKLAAQKNSKYKPIYSSSSFHSLVESRNKNRSKPERSYHQREKYITHPRKEYTEPLIPKACVNRKPVKIFLRTSEELDHRNKTKRTKRVHSEVDNDFIADIIKRQYRPIKLFGKRDSDFSQFSAPVCRDQEFKVRHEIQEGIELCSCCFNDSRRKRNRYVRHTDLSDMRSICDTHLYSSKNNRSKLSKDNIDDYNNSALYDVIPVKEKSSPKTRRKFTEDNMIPYKCFKEVPPSPKSNRPRFNLKVQQYANYEDSLYNRGHQRRRKSPTRDVQKKIMNVMESDLSSESYPQRTQPENFDVIKSRKPNLSQEEFITMKNLQYPNNVSEKANIPNNDTTQNTMLTDSIADKTDKTLCEIKDILQTFLLEIKKESTYSDKSDGTSKIDNKQLHENTQANCNMIPNSGDSLNNYNARQTGIPSFLPAFPNPCCYPMLPVCPMNYMQNGYVIPSPSYTCNLCAKSQSSKDHGNSKDNSNKNKPLEEVNRNNETQELIKEIYKFVSQKSKSSRTRAECDTEHNNSTRSKNGPLFDQNNVINRYGSNKASKQDAKVGTSRLKCYSKSCEALGSKFVSDTYYTSASYSDTILEKLSLEVTQSSTETELSTDVPEEKIKRNEGKLRKVLNPLRLFRRKKKDVIEETNENESESVVEIGAQRKPPFQQHIQSYAMHSQEYYHPPPVPPQQYCHPACHECIGHDYGSRNNHPQPPPPDFYNKHKPYYAPEHRYNPNYSSPPPCVNYEHHYNQNPPQVPLCLKEVEVKSIGTQSDRKETFLQKITKKMPSQQQEVSRDTSPVKEKTNFWKTLQETSKQNHNDTLNFSLKTQKDLAQGDMNLRNAVVKKLFYKRNPFSPRNLIVRTLLGKDKSSYGNPPKVFRPRMFL